MALAYTLHSWWPSSAKHQEPQISNGSSINSSPDAIRELDALKFSLAKGANMASSSRRVKRKWHSREERKIDTEFDVVLVPPDAGCVSGSESDDSDWSVGWLEPHGPGFQTEDEMDTEPDNSFAVLVPCYGRGYGDFMEDLKSNILTTFGNIPDGYATESKKYIEIEQWLSSLQNIADAREC